MLKYKKVIIYEGFLLNNIDDSITYDLLLEATDFFTTISYFITLSTAYTLMDLKANGKAIAFSKSSEKENTLESALNIEYKNLNVNGDLLIKEHPLLDLFYPLGSIYLSTSDLNPSTFFGGLWEQIAQGKTLIGVGTGTDINEVSKTFAVGDTGGEYEHTLTIDEMPNHQHDVNDFSYGKQGITVTGYNDASGWNTPSIRSLTGAGSSGTLMATPAGKALSHNNMQPYLAIYIWKRIS